MNGVVAGTTEPGNDVEHLRSVPAALEDSRVGRARDEMVVCQRDPVAGTELAGAGVGAGAAP